MDLKIGLDKPVTRAFDFKLTDIIFVAIIVLLVNQYFSYEYEGKILELILANKSRSRIAMDKILSLGGVIFVISLALYSSNIIAAASIYGWTDLTRLVQSIAEFRSLPIPMTVLDFFGLAIALKFLNGFTLAILLFAMFTIFKRTSPVLLILGTIFFIFLALYHLVRVNSIYDELHYINPFYGMDSYNLIKNYKNINFMGQPMHILFFWLIILGLVFMLSAGLAIYQFRGAHVLHNRFKFSRIEKFVDRSKQYFDSKILGGGVFLLELRKILGRTIIFTVILLLILHNRANPNYNFNNTYRAAYSSLLQRFDSEDITEENLLAVETYRDEVLIDVHKHQSVKDVELTALDKIHKQIEEILKVEANQNIQVQLVDDYTYSYWMNNSEYDQRDNILTFLFSILTIGAIFSSENRANTIKLIRISPEFKKVRQSKLSIAVIISVLMGSLVWLKRYFEFLEFDSFSKLSAPIQSHFGWYNFPLHITLGQYLVSMLVLRLIALAVFAIFVLAISAITQFESQSIIWAIIINIFPIFAILLNLTEVKYFSLSWLVAVNGVLNQAVGYWIWALMLLLGIALLSLLVIGKRWRPQKD